jgi:hypothetical protein
MLVYLPLHRICHRVEADPAPLRLEVAAKVRAMHEQRLLDKRPEDRHYRARAPADPDMSPQSPPAPSTLRLHLLPALLRRCNPQRRHQWATCLTALPISRLLRCLLPRGESSPIVQLSLSRVSIWLPMTKRRFGQRTTSTHSSETRSSRCPLKLRT